MRKSTAAVIISSIIVVVATLGVAFAPEISPRNMAMPRPELSLQVQGVTKSNGFYNVSLSIINTADSPVQIEEVQPEANSEAITDSPIYCNGTHVGILANPNGCSLGSKDILLVNVIIPAAEYLPGCTVVVVYTAHAMYYRLA